MGRDKYLEVPPITARETPVAFVPEKRPRQRRFPV
jgi:hypothetical protein